MTRFRSDRIWRLGEKELSGSRHFIALPPTEPHDALEDRNPSQLGLTAHQLTDLAWHRHWGLP